MKTLHTIQLIIICLMGMHAGCGQEAPPPSSSPEGLVVRYSTLSSKIRGLDPMDIGDTTSSAIGGNIFDCLYQYHYLKRPYQLIPNLAAAMPTVSEDSLTYTIPIRDDVVFFDDECFKATSGKGRGLTAADFIYAWKRIANIKNVSKNWWIFDGRIVGFDEFREYTKTIKDKADVDYSKPVEGLVALNDHLLQIKLKKPWPQLQFMLAHLPTAPVPHEAVNHYGEEILNHPVGTGPFILEDWKRGSKIILSRNPTFRDERYPSEGEPGDKEAGLLTDAGKRLPLIDRAEFLVIQEDQPRWLKFMAGDLDVAGIPKDSFDKVINTNRQLTPEMLAKGIILTKYQTPLTLWYGINMEDPILGTNLPLRRAMNLALNRKEYIKLFANDRAIPARGILPAMFGDFNPELVSPYINYDPQKAKQLLVKAQRIHGGPLPTITMTMGGTDSTARQIGQYLTRTYKAVGLDFQVEYMDWPTSQDKVKNKSAQIYAMGWYADYPDSENFLLLFYGPNGSPGPNNMNYKNAEFDELFEQMGTMPSSPERKALVQKMEQMVIEDLPCILTSHPIAFALHYNWALNRKPHVFGEGHLKYGNIDVERRHKAKTG